MIGAAMAAATLVSCQRWPPIPLVTPWGPSQHPTPSRRTLQPSPDATKTTPQFDHVSTIASSW